MANGSKFLDDGAQAEAQQDGGDLRLVTMLPSRKQEAEMRFSVARADPSPGNIRAALQGVGFNEKSVKRLMEVNPRLALIAIEAKMRFDNDPNHAVYDANGNYLGHKTFQVQENGGFRTVGDQKIATGAGNSQANADLFQSRHQHGQALDFWIYEPDGKGNMVMQKDGVRRWPGMAAKGEDGKMYMQPDGMGGYGDYQHVAWWFTAIAKRDYGIQSKLQGDNEKEIPDNDRMRIYQRDGKSYDWGHIQLPERFDAEWERNPRDGRVFINGVLQPDSWIDPSIHSKSGAAAYQPAKPPAPKPR
jgi:hypothetical protein